MYRSRTVGVVLPAYDEEAGIAQAVKDFLAQDAVDAVTVIDNNSRDRTAELAAEAGATVIHEPRQGLGWALRRGLAEAGTDTIVLCEPDGTFVAADLDKLLGYSDEFAMVMGSRTTRELIWRQANMGWFLRLGNFLLGKLIMLLFNGPSISDCGCTFRVLDRATAEQMTPLLTVGGSHFLPEMVCLALRMGIPIIEIPVQYRGRVGESKITGSWRGVLGTGGRMLGLVLAYRVKAGLGRVGAVRRRK